MKSLTSLASLFIILTSTSAYSYEVATLKYDPQFILEKVLEKKRLEFKPSIETPSIHMQNTTPLKQFQDAVEPQWGFRPDFITNAFVDHSNEIYLLDELAYYQKTGRCIDDSLAHEFTHYVQSKYLKYDMNDDSLEWDAIEVQTWFRENFCKN